MTLSLFPTNLATAPGSSHWRIAADGDPVALDLHSRHYSARTYADGRPRRLIVGPGEKLVLVAHDDTAMFVWRRFISLDDQDGVSCSVFRNEGATLSSNLIREADAIADARWPVERRHYTYVSPSRIRSTNPGCCFRKAGWRTVGHTKGGHGRERLIVLERVREAS